MAEATFFNVWRTQSAAKQEELLSAMRTEAPELQAKPGFVELRAWSGQGPADHRVIVLGRWESEKAFNAAVADDEAAQESRRRLAALGTPEAGLFAEAFRFGPTSAEGQDVIGISGEATISSNAGYVTYVQVWTVNTPENQQRWLEAMHRNIGLLTKQPGFVSMTLHSSLDKTRTAVYAQWESEASLKAAIELPEARQRHDEMARWGTPDGALYVVDSVYLADESCR